MASFISPMDYYYMQHHKHLLLEEQINHLNEKNFFVCMLIKLE